MIRAAITAGAETVIVGVGGTTTTDGGAGLRRGLGKLPSNVKLVAALDVENALLRPNGAAAVFAPQKGADPSQIRVLEQYLTNLHLDPSDRRGAGAGGGIGAMLMHLGAETRWGAELLMDETGFRDAITNADLCITAEGRIDAQTLAGKVVARVVDYRRTSSVDCVAVGGSVDPSIVAELAERGIDVHEQTDVRVAGAEIAHRYLRPNVRDHAGF